jgi:hypothetical protein
MRGTIELTAWAPTFMAGGVRGASLVAVIVVLGSPMAAHAGLSSCLACDTHAKNNDCCAVNPDFAIACGTYIALRTEAQNSLSKDEFNNCVAAECLPTSAGRCTVILGCVQGCRANFFPHIPESQIQKEAFGDFMCNGKPLKSQGRMAAARACRLCNPSTVTTSSTTTTSSSSSTSTVTTTSTSTSIAGQSTTTAVTTTTATPTTAGPPERLTFIKDPCFNECILEFSSVSRCYASCRSKCGGDFVALPICQRSCRDLACLAIKARCTQNNNQTHKIRTSYLTCCRASSDGCRGVDEAECETTTTTTSSSTSTVTSTSSPSTTTTSPQIP